MTYRQARVCYFTGTGNSYRVARWLEAACAERGIEAQVAAINQTDPHAVEAPGPATLLALTTPTHGFTAPWLMLRFVWRLPRGRGTHAVVIPTRGGGKLGAGFSPGMEGTAGYLLALLLWLKGYTVRGVWALDMPSNWTAVYPGYGRASAEAIIAHTESKMRARMARVLAGERVFAGGVCLLLGLLLLPVSAGYLLVGRFFFAKLFYASSDCTGCRLCAEACPAHAIRMRGNPPRPYWTFACESCMRCMNICPTQAVEASYPLAVGLYFIANVPVWMLFLNWLGRQWPALAALNTLLIQVGLQYAYFLLALALTYAVFTLLLRVPFLNRLFTAVTPTHYYRRYHEPETRLRDLGRSKI